MGVPDRTIQKNRTQKRERERKKQAVLRYGTTQTLKGAERDGTGVLINNHVSAIQKHPQN